MTRAMSHDEAFLALGALALDALDGAERVAVLTHVAECELCRAELESLRAAATNIAFAAPLAADTATGSRNRIRDRLTSRATAEGQARRLAHPPLVFPKANDGPAPLTPARAFHSNPLRRHPAEWLSMAIGVVLVVALGALLMSYNENVELKDRLSSVPTHDVGARRDADSLAALLASRDSLIASLVGRDVSMMTLTSRSAKEPYARMFWDRTHNTWTLIARNMPALKPGRAYQLWIVTSRATVSAGTFETVNGAGTMHATYAVNPDNLRAIAVTEEPAGGVPQPTGETIISVTR
jgi:hypothetical protein